VVAGLITPVNGAALARLSERERDVLDLMAQGLTNAAIATRLTLSERTVEAHVRHILTKLDITEGQDGHRRVLAVLAYLNEIHAQQRAPH
jgi:DNA-binding NarL/FixJ family response regulator